MRKIEIILFFFLLVGCTQTKNNNFSNQESTSVETDNGPKFTQCDIFFQIGKTYKFDKYNFTHDLNSSVTFSSNSLYINSPFFDQQCEIVKVSCYKNMKRSGHYYADLEIIFEDEVCEARFDLGPTSRDLTINYPKPSSEIHYIFSYSH